MDYNIGKLLRKCEYVRRSFGLFIMFISDVTVESYSGAVFSLTLFEMALKSFFKDLPCFIRKNDFRVSLLC